MHGFERYGTFSACVRAITKWATLQIYSPIPALINKPSSYQSTIDLLVKLLLHWSKPPTCTAVYRPLASLGAALHFALCDLPAIDPMYRFSLAAFMRLFEHALMEGGSSGLWDEAKWTDGSSSVQGFCAGLLRASR